MLKYHKYVIRVAFFILLSILLVAGVGFACWKILGKGWFDDRTLLRENPVAQIYTESYQEQVQQKLDQLKTTGSYTPENPLLLVNPYGTNTTGLYIYFETEQPVGLSYEIHAEGYADFSRVLTTIPSTIHEHQIIGLVPSEYNTVTLHLTDEQGNICQSVQIEQQAPDLKQGEAFATVTVEKGSSTQLLGDTLYTMLGPQEKTTFTYQPYTIAYDTAGIARMEIPLVEYRTERQVFVDDVMYYNISYNTIVGVNSLGKMVQRFDLNHYSMHHDFIAGGDNDLLVLASRDDATTVEDRIVKIDLQSGKIRELVDLRELFSKYVNQLYNELESNWIKGIIHWTQLKSYSTLDWIHVNSIALTEGDSLLLSSRETSTLIKLENIYEKPAIDYLIGSSDYWKGTGYEALLLTQIGDFSLHAGQHTLNILTNSSLPEGQYYLTMFNNNNAISWSNAYDFSQDTAYIGANFDWFEDAIQNAGSNGLNSFYYKYLVDENAGTFELVESVPVAYSGYISSVEDIGSNKVICSGISAEAVILDENNQLIQSMTADDVYWWYRVFGYDYKGFWFV